ncbi:MAG: invasion associated locus B family protein [Alphaproteobacteria bacterium]
MKTRFLMTALCLLAAAPALASSTSPRLLQVYEDWDAYVMIEGSDTVCYMASKPKSSNGKYDKRGDVFALITHRPSENSRNVFSYLAGYIYRPGADAVIKIDETEYPLFTQDDIGWAPDADTNSKIAQAMKNGKTMTVRGTSTKGTETVDTFSLKGSSAAYERIGRECN